MNILIKLMSIISLVIAPHIAVSGGHLAAAAEAEAREIATENVTVLAAEEAEKQEGVENGSASGLDKTYVLAD